MRGSKTVVAVVAALTMVLAGCSGGDDPAVPGVSVPDGTTSTADSTATSEDGSTATGPAIQPPAETTSEEPTEALPSATAGDCTAEFSGGLVDDDISVPSGETCVLTGVRIDGNITVASDATLRARDVFVDGNIEGDGHAEVTVQASTVNGNIQVENGHVVVVDAVTIDGDLQAEGHTGLLVFDNNIIGGNMQCEGNDPAPTGTGNQVEGDKEDQCSAL